MVRKILSRLREEHFADLLRNSFSTFAVRIGGLIAGYLFTLMVSRLYGSDVLGAHTISVTVLMIFTVVGRMGMDFNIVKRFANATQDNRWDLVHEIYRKTLFLIVPVGLILTASFFFAAPMISENLFHKPHLAPFLQIMALAVLPMTLRFVNAECYRGFRMHRHYAYSQNVSYFLYATVILGGMTLFSTDELNPNIAFLVALIMLAVSSTLFIKKKITGHTLAISNEVTTGTLYRESLPMMLSGSMLLISGWINTLMLGVFATDTEVGIYSVILKISALSMFMLMSINAVSAPRYAQLYAANDISGLKKYTRQAAAIIFYTSVPVFAGIILLRHWLLGMFGEEFLAGSSALLIMMAGQFCNVFAGSVGHFLNMTGHQHVFRNIVLTATLINLILCALLIPALGLIGSAIAGAVFMAVWNIASMVYIHRKFGIRTYYLPFGNQAFRKK
jgi:O-antigen/teichoic acid export membrane protein